MRHGVRGASRALAVLAERAGLSNDIGEEGGILLAGSDAVVSSCSARWLDRDPARALDAGLPAVCAAQWIADLHLALRPDLPVFVVRPSEMEIRRDYGGKSPSRVFGPEEVLAQMKEPHERAATEEEARVVVDLTPSSIVVRRKPTIRALVPGATETVKHGVNGLLVEPDDPRGAARLLDLVVRDEELRDSLERGAREFPWPTLDESAAELKRALDEIATLGVTPSEPKPFLPAREQSHTHPVMERPGLRKLRERLK